MKRFSPVYFFSTYELNLPTVGGGGGAGGPFVDGGGAGGPFVGGGAGGPLVGDGGAGGPIKSSIGGKSIDFSRGLLENKSCWFDPLS